MSCLDDTWISATSTYNYMMKDPLLDWLKYHHGSLRKNNISYQEIIDTSIKNTKNNYNFTNFIMEQGNIFEKKVMKLIIKKFGTNRVKEINGQENPRSITKYQQTIEAMKYGYPIIHSGVIHNEDNKTFGIPDLLVRSDWLNFLVDEKVISDKDSQIKSPKFNQKWHYRVVDIKFTSLLLRSDGKMLLNSCSFPAYKSQLLIYNWGIGKIQGYTPNHAYILGRRWRYNSCSQTFIGNSCFDRLGIIDYEDKDKEYIEKTNNALQWLKDVRKEEAGGWDIINYPLSRWELYPNMCNNHDYPWHGVKKKIADQTKELTSLWMVGPKNRNLAFSEGVYQWSDPKCRSEVLGFNSNKIGNTLDKIIKINQNDEDKISPQFITNNIFDWKNKQKIEFYVDFETVGGSLSSIKKLPLAKTNNMIFMIGVGYINPDTNKWRYKNFTVESLSNKEEERICNEFSNFIYKKSLKYNVKNPKCIHWSKAEDNMWNDAVDRHNHSENWNAENWEWLDLLAVFKNEPIVIKGCLSFGLKEVASTMKNHGFIKSSWDKNIECIDGQSAMIVAQKAHSQAKKLGIKMTQISSINDIIKYNEIDVKVLYEIITYLRNNHCQNTKEDSENTKIDKKRKRNDEEEDYKNKRLKN